MDIRRSVCSSLFFSFLSLSLTVALYGLPQEPAKPTVPSSAPAPTPQTKAPPGSAGAGTTGTVQDAAKDQAAKDHAAKNLDLTSAACYQYESKNPDTRVPDPHGCGLGKTIVLTFKNLADWTTGTSATEKPNRAQDIVLLLNGKMLKGVTPTPSGTNELQFELKRLDLVTGDQDSVDNRATWNALMSRARIGTQHVPVGVVLKDGATTFADQPVDFTIMSPYWPGAAIFLLALLILFLILAKNSDILRDGPTAAAAGPWWKFGVGAGPKNSFSLARCQMAWWFFIVIASFLYIWMVFGDTDTLTSGALVLMGISAGTGFSSFLVDSSKEDTRTSLLAQKTALTQQLATVAASLEAAPADTALLSQQQQQQAQLDQVNKNLASLPSPVGVSEGFLNDILRDETGISFHRFQMAAWTIVLGFVFVVAVYRNLAMPDFSATLLGLMGISAGTYVGFKIPDPPK